MRRQCWSVPPMVCAFALAWLGPGASGAMPTVAAQVCRSTGPVNSCVHYRQQLGKGGIKLILKSRCKEMMSCTISWELSCTGDKAPRRDSHIFTLMAGATEVVDASAAACGDKGWQIRNVRWNCQSD